MGRPRKKAEPEAEKPTPKRASRKSSCPRAHTHRLGTFCQACNSMPTTKGE